MANVWSARYTRSFVSNNESQAGILEKCHSVMYNSRKNGPHNFVRARKLCFLSVPLLHESVDRMKEVLIRLVLVLTCCSPERSIKINRALDHIQNALTHYSHERLCSIK